MIPKEKAKELVYKYKLICDRELNNSGNIALAQEYAIIAVNEIIKALRKDLPEIGLGKGYWYSVRKEIENI